VIGVDTHRHTSSGCLGESYSLQRRCDAIDELVELPGHRLDYLLIAAVADRRAQRNSPFPELLAAAAFPNAPSRVQHGRPAGLNLERVEIDQHLAAGMLQRRRRRHDELRQRASMDVATARVTPTDSRSPQRALWLATIRPPGQRVKISVHQPRRTRPLQPPTRLLQSTSTRLPRFEVFGGGLTAGRKGRITRKDNIARFESKSMPSETPRAATAQPRTRRSPKGHCLVTRIARGRLLGA
jgi:hypothetical protein